MITKPAVVVPQRVIVTSLRDGVSPSWKRSAAEQAAAERHTRPHANAARSTRLPHQHHPPAGLPHAITAACGKDDS